MPNSSYVLKNPLTIIFPVTQFITFASVIHGDYAKQYHNLV